MTAHRNDIQGLRAVAVLLVVLDHAGVGFLKGGYVGVDVFFVVSGFLITGVLLAGVEKRGYLSFVDFYVRRAKRILPAATLTLVVTMIAAYYLLNFVRARQVVWDSIWASLFFANVRFANEGTDYFAQGQPPSPIQHFWSLSIEEQFYFVWPALLAVVVFGVALGRQSGARRRSREGVPVITTWGLRRLFVTIVVLAAASLAWSVHYTGVDPPAAYFSTFTRVWELALGAALAIASVRMSHLPLAPRLVLGWVGLIAIGAAGVAFSSSTAFPGYAALLPTVGAALLIAAGIGSDGRFAAGRLLSTPVLRYVGDRSYAFYLWHWPVLVIAAQYVGRDLSVGVNLLLLVGAFLLSMVSYRLFENPIRRARWRRPVSAALIPVSIAAVASVAVLTLSAIDAKIVRVQEIAAAADAAQTTKRPTVRARTQGAPLPAVAAAVRAAKQGAKIPVGLTPPVDKLLAAEYLYNFPAGCVPVNADQTTSEICRLGDSAGLKSIVVFGDSHMQMWLPTILAMAERDGWVVIPLVKSGCVPSSWLGKGYPGTPAATIRQCHAWYGWAAQRLKGLRPDVTLMSGCCGSAAGSTATETKRAFISLTNTARRVSKSVLVLADNEGIHRQPVDCLLARGATMTTCTSTWPKLRFALNDALASSAKAKGFGFLNTRGWFCSKSQCPMVVGRTIVYRDTGHITRPYSLVLAAPFRAAFRRCILDACPR